jgi:hypothetical protein
VPPDSEEAFMLDKHMKYPKWQKPYLTALMEVNQQELSAKIAVAEAAVSQSNRELTTTAWDTDEHLALRDAAFGLHLLKANQLGVDVSPQK